MELLARGKKPISIDKLLAYAGLEMAMSLVQIGSIKEYWAEKCFSGHGDFHDTMSHTKFEDICAPSHGKISPMPQKPTVMLTMCALRHTHNLYAPLACSLNGSLA